MYKFFYIAIIIILIAIIAIVGWKILGKRISNRIANENNTWENILIANNIYQENQIAFFGDSEISLWPMRSSFGMLPIRNRGLSGCRATESMQRFRDGVLSLHPKTIFLLIGTNDLNHGISLKDIVNSIQDFIDEGEKINSDFVVCSLLPVSPKIAEKGRPVVSILEINRNLKKICKDEGLIYLDFYKSLIDQDGFFDKKYSDDGLHPNNEGYITMSGITIPVIIEKLCKK